MPRYPTRVFAGVKYIIDRHMMTCDIPSPLMIGDDFVTRWANGSIGMKTAAEYFHSESANIQYAGQVGWGSGRGLAEVRLRCAWSQAMVWLSSGIVSAHGLVEFWYGIFAWSG